MKPIVSTDSKPQEHPMDLATVREKIHPEDREAVFRIAEDAISSRSTLRR